MQEKETGIHYAWFILVGCCALTGGMGLLLNTGGQYFVAIANELGCPVSSIATYYTFQGLGMAIAAPFVGKMLPKANLRVLLTLSYAIVIVAYAAMSFYQAPWMWYASGAIIGLAGSFCFIIPTPVILSRWFMKKNGFVVGLAMAFSGIVGVVANPLIQMAIGALGWRMTYIVVAVITAVLVLPFTLFVIKFDPAQKGLTPYGYEENAGQQAQGSATQALSGVSVKVANKSLAFWMLFLAGGLFSFITGYSQLLPTIATTMGLAGISGLITSMAMVGNMGAKIGIGAISDKLGALKTTVLGVALSVLGFALLIFAGSNTAIVLAGALFVGVTMSMTVVAMPVLARHIFGVKDYAQIYATLNIGISLIGCFGTAIISLMADYMGGYQITFYLGIAICIICVALVIGSIALGKKLPRE